MVTMVEGGGGENHGSFSSKFVCRFQKMNTPQAEVFVLKEGSELKLSEDTALQAVGGVENILPGAVMLILLRQPTEEREDTFPSKITIQIIREYSEGMLSKDVLVIK